MNSAMHGVSFHRDFVAADTSASCPRGKPVLARRSILRRVVDAIDLSRQRAVERDIAQDLGLGNPDSRFTDAIERRLFERLAGDRGFRP
jgi:hypothetical protein